MQVTREGNGFSITNDKKLYALQDNNLIVISEQRIKSARVSFYTNDEWDKLVEKAEKRQAKLDSSVQKDGEK